MVLQPITSFLLHPIIFYLVENLVTTLVIGFTSPSSIVRPAVFPLHFVCVWKVLPTCPEMLYRIPWAGIVGGHIIVSLYHYVEVALISKWSFESQGPTSSATPEGLDVKDKPNGGDRATRQMDHGVSFWERLMFGYFGATSTRNIGTPYIVKNTPSFSSKNPDYIPSRAAFLLRKAILIISAFLVVDLASQPAQTLEQNAVLYSAETVPILGGNGENLTGEKILSRFVTVLGYWVCTWLVIDGYSSFLYFVFVGLGLEDVRLYRPNFGPISEAYSIRQFWGVVWHQHLRKHLSGPADVIVYKVLRLRKGPLLTRYAHLSLVFLLSGLLHAWTEIGQGFTWRESGQIQFFMTQVLGIMLEDAVQALFRFVRGVKRGSAPTRGSRVIGYIWLVIFFWWSTPAWFYPRLRVSGGDERDQILPFSLFGQLMKA